MADIKMKLALCVTVLGLAMVWVTQIAIPIESMRPTQIRLQQYFVAYRLVNLGFTAEQAADAIRDLDVERLEKLSGTLGSGAPNADFISVIGGILAMTLLGSILLL